MPRARSSPAIFVDRDGTLNEDPGYVHRVQDLRLKSGVARGLQVLGRLGLPIVVVTNQGGIGRGRFTEAQMHAFNAALRSAVERAGAQVSGIYWCPHHPLSPDPSMSRACDCRKPEPGLLLRAAKDLDLDLERSVLIGDSAKDVEAARRAGCRSILIGAREGEVADHVASDFAEAANIVSRMYETTTAAPRRNGPSHDWERAIRDSMSEHAEVLALARADAALQTAAGQCARLIHDAVTRDRRVFLCGNGGSAADAQHIAAEFTGHFREERRALSVEALSVNTSTLTAIGNDYGYEHVFARQVEAHGKPGDVLIGISTSGNSPNVLHAIDAAKRRGMTTVAWTGMGGGKLAKRADLALRVPSDATPRIQEIHILLGHAIGESIERLIG